MKHIPVRNAHQLIPWLLKAGSEKDLHGPVVIEICKPEEPVIFWPQLKANPFIVYHTSMQLITQASLPMITEQFVIKEVRGVVEATIFCHDGNGLMFTAVCMIQQALAQLNGLKPGKVWVVVASPQFEDGIAGTVGALKHDQITKSDPYAQAMFKTVDLVQGDKEEWLREVKERLEVGPAVGYKSWYVRRVLSPILEAEAVLEGVGDSDRKEAAEKAMEIVRPVAATDWQFAFDSYLVQWAGLEASA